MRGFEFKRRQAVQQETDFHFLDEIIVVINGFSVQAQSDQHAGLKHVPGRGYAVTHPANYMTDGG